MQTKASWFLILALFTTLTPARQARAEPVEELLLHQTLDITTPRVLAAEGPGEGFGTVSLGVAMLGPVPTFDLRYVRGLGEFLMVDGAVSTIGVLQRLRLGGRYLIFDREDVGALAVRMSLMEAHSFAEPVLAAGAGPGVIYSFGEEVRISVGLDVAWSFLSESNDRTVGDGFQIQPAIGLELPLDDDLQLFLEASSLMVVDPDSIYALPIFTAGLAW